MSALAFACAEPVQQISQESTTSDAIFASARVVARGIPGAGAIAQVGPFHRGGPIHDRADFAPFTVPGAVLNANRLLVASTSNFGAPLALTAQPAGSILSIDPSGSTVEVSSDFATAGGQASGAGGTVQVYCANNAAFLNSLNNPGAATAGLTAIALPTGISLNSGNGRPWFSNAPNGANGDGTITVIDPNGRPLAGAPSAVAGGVFAGNLTNRGPATTHGLTNAALATALITRSPDGSGRAVFAAVLADGSIEQVHVQRGVDALAPPGTITPFAEITTAVAESTNKHTVGRVGIAFNWVPATENIALFVTDPQADRIAVVEIHDDGTLFTAGPTHYLTSPAFDIPIDVAAVLPEFVDGNFSSATTMAGGSDLYVLNRGTNTIVRVRQDGDFVAIRAIHPNSNLGTIRPNGIAVSQDGATIFVTAVGANHAGYVLAIDAFGDTPVTDSLLTQAHNAGATDIPSIGADLFSREISPFQLLGPLFNGRACSDCHNTPFAGGMSPLRTTINKVARVENGNFDPLIGSGGPVARAHSIREDGFPCPLRTGIPPQANVVSPRSAMTLRGTGLIENIQLAALRTIQAAQPASVRGRFNVLADGRIGRFGWKAQIATLPEFMGDAFRTEMGLTNGIVDEDLVQGCGSRILRPELDAVPVQAVTAFMDSLNPPDPGSACLTSPGAALFASVGCATCHTPAITSEAIQARLHSDLLLHDMGPGLADNYLEGSATGSEFRTMPLWRVSDRVHFLHDGRADTIAQAISFHGGQADSARINFDALSAADRQALLDYLNCI